MVLRERACACVEAIAEAESARKRRLLVMALCYTRVRGGEPASAVSGEFWCVLC